MSESEDDYEINIISIDKLGYCLFPGERTALQVALDLNKVYSLYNHSEKRIASNSDIRRWVTDGSIKFDGKALKPNERCPNPVIWSIVAFPKSKHKITLI